MFLEKRDVLAAYPRRKMECSEADLEMAICILEGVLERKGSMENLLRIHFSIPETREQYIKTFILAAECMKEMLEVEGGGLQTIVKQLGSGGTADPLNQRASAGWKAIKTAEILSDEFMVRIESSSSFSAAAN